MSSASYLSEAMADEFYKIATKLAHVDKTCSPSLTRMCWHSTCSPEQLPGSHVHDLEGDGEKARPGRRQAGEAPVCKNTYATQYPTCASALGLTVVSRVKIVIPKTEEAPKENKFQEI